jgi:hypothetical protein
VLEHIPTGNPNALTVSCELADNRFKERANKLANGHGRLWPAAEWSWLPAPIRPETRAMPAEYRLSREHFQGVHHFGREAAKPDKQQSIDIATALRGSAIALLVHIDLTSKDEDFGLQCCSRPDESNHCAPDQWAEIELTTRDFRTSRDSHLAGGAFCGQSKGWWVHIAKR